MEPGSGTTSVTWMLSNTVNSKEGCRVVLVFTSETPRAKLSPPSAPRLEAFVPSNVAMRLPSMSQ